MGEITRKMATSLQKGNYVLVDGVACIVQSTQTSRPGKHGHAKVRISAIGMIDGKKREMVTPNHEIDCPIVGKKNANVLSVQGNMANLMDMETYETFDLEIPEELKGEVTEGVTVLYWEIMDDKVMKQVTNKEA